MKGALCIPLGAPPPWLMQMQSVGPPPAWPNLKIPRLNAPIPKGSFGGFHPGGWGRPPVDEYNRPLYGDVFGVMEAGVPIPKTQPLQRNLWGLIQEDEGEEEDSGIDGKEEDDGSKEECHDVTQDVQMSSEPVEA